MIAKARRASYTDEELNTFLALWSHEWEWVHDDDVRALSPTEKGRADAEAWNGPSYTRDLNSMARIEAELMRLNKAQDYLTVLLDVLELYQGLPQESYPASFLAPVATASARQKAEAAYRVVKRLF